MYYSYLINGSGSIPWPITRQEQYLYYLCKNGFGAGSAVTPEMIDSAVNRYLEENPVHAGATEEEVARINENAIAIEQLQDDLEEVFQSVSNGKTLIASAITDKGIETDAKDAFATMAGNISKISVGDIFEGNYNLVPKISSQFIETKDKVMKDNVTVAEIPFHEVSNETGKTVIIGGII